MDNLWPENGELWQNLFYYMNEALVIGEIILDIKGKSDDYLYLEVNQAFEKIIGKPAAGILGKTQRELGPVDPQWIELFRQVVITGTPASQVVYSSCYSKWFDLRAFSLGRKRFAFLLMDITGRQSEKNSGQALGDINEIGYSEQEFGEMPAERARQRIGELMNERRRLYDILETLPVMICLLAPDYHIVFANRSFRERFGEAGGRYCYEYCFGNTQPCGFCEAYHVLKTGKSHHWELACPDKRVLEIYDFPFIDADGSLLILEMNIDITERIKYEEALAKERELLMVTLDSLAEGVIAIDSENRIFLINQAAVNLTGYSKLEAIDEPLNRILCLMDDKTGEPVDIIPQNSKNQRRIPPIPVLVSRDLKKIPISFTCSRIKSSAADTGAGAIIGTVIVFADITEKQKAGQELMKADKLESLGILAGGIAHDFNNLLAAILSNIQLAQIKYKKNQEFDKYLQESVDSTRRASELTRQLLTFAKGGAPVKKAASLAELIRDTAHFALRGSPVKVECRISEALWPVEADSGQISQVIYNLVINAKQAMPKGGRIHINAENIIIGPNQRFYPGNYIKIAVRDQGVGIPKENLAKIFDPFFTTKKEGSGLGLATSYSIIRQHDGYLEVESEAGLGATFYIYLPALTQAAPLTEPQPEVSVTREGLRILLMDDEEVIVKPVREMLEHFGHQVTAVLDGAGAVEAYKQAYHSGAPFDIVIMDLTVPGGMGGQEAIAHLRVIDPEIKAIVCSGYANDPVIAEHHKFGFSGVVTKPYKYDELNEVLWRVVELNKNFPGARKPVSG